MRAAVVAPDPAVLAADLAEAGIEAVVFTYVDNAGVARVKGVPTGRLAPASKHGVGMSPVFDAFVADDSITSSPSAGGPVGDLRLIPDLRRLVALAAQPGLAWVPVDRRSQTGDPHPQCQRQFATRLVERAASRGITMQMGFEIEFILARSTDDELVPATVAPAYGANRLVELGDFSVELLRALRLEGVEVLQLHPEYAPGQFEVSTAPRDPVHAADDSVLVRQTIRGVTARHGLAVTFSPAVEVGGVGNGAHLHFGIHQGKQNLLAGGRGTHGMTSDGEAFLAGVLDALPALLAIGAPSVASYQRLVPQHWAAPYVCWGKENREAALRLVTGEAGAEQHDANAEVKVFDATANPYLVVGAVIACGLDGIDRQLRLPAETTTDPATLDAAARPERLPTSLDVAVETFSRSDVLRDALGNALFETIIAVRHAEIARFAGASPDEIVASTRWRH
ncbi:MAG: glutamine synthetase [Actinobacteria bacterium]|nr:glutamine synthetase [Actinomycetota bacterium]